jgi:ubiquinone/menaquinone biosynthesis C-methylase UbiE
MQRYTPGHGETATSFMAQRTLRSHGEFFVPLLAPGLAVLDCGCGPGTITLGLAEQVAPGKVVGVDREASQIEHARAGANLSGIQNVSFQTADCYALPFEAGTFDRVFSHALLEHLADPVRALKELQRVLKPGGCIGVCSPDWGGFLLAPPSAALSHAVDAYTSLQTRNGGDPRVGCKLGHHLAAAGFEDVRLAARYECYPALDFIGEYLALQLERAGEAQAAATFRSWSLTPGGMFAQAWVAATGQKQLAVSAVPGHQQA